ARAQADVVAGGVAERVSELGHAIDELEVHFSGELVHTWTQESKPWRSAQGNRGGVDGIHGRLNEPISWNCSDARLHAQEALSLVVSTLTLRRCHRHHFGSFGRHGFESLSFLTARWRFVRLGCGLDERFVGWFTVDAIFFWSTRLLGSKVRIGVSCS